MIRKINFLFGFVLSLLSINLLTICDPSIHDVGDFIDVPDIGDGLFGLIDSKTTLNKLITDLEFMNSTCYEDQDLAAAQSFTIMLSYGIFDMSLDSSTLDESTLRNKKFLYEQIRLMFMYTNTDYTQIIDDYEFIYDSSKVYDYTVDALEYCYILLSNY